MKKSKIIWASILIGTLGIGLAACNPSGPSVKLEVEIEITSTTTTVMAGETLQLSAEAKNGKTNEVSWSSSDTNVATIGEATGLVTALRRGTTTITATAVDDYTKTATVVITVNDLSPESITISGYKSTTLRSHSTLQLSATVLPSDKIQTISWKTSDPNIATVSETGLVSFVGEGEVTISAVSTANDEVKGEVKFNPYYIVSSFWGNESWDFSGLHGMEPTFKSKNSSINQNAVLNNSTGKYYAFEATAKITDPSTSDTWSRVGLGHIPTNNSDKIHALMVSPGPNFSQRKTVVMDVVKGNVQWGTVTDRSQVWGQHDQNVIDYSNVKLSAVRNGNDYYYFINNELYWVEKDFNEFSDVDTYPAFHTGNTNVEFSKISVVTGEKEVQTYLANNPTSNNYYYATYKDNVVVDKTNNTIKFINCENGVTTNVKDQAIKPLGSAMLLKDKTNTKISFDFTLDLIGNRDANPALAITVTRYDSSTWEARSGVICETKAGFTGWNSNGDLNAGIGDGGREYTTPLLEGQTYHVDFYKLSSTSTGTDTRLVVNGVDYAHGWDDGYHGAHTFMIGTRDMNVTITNLTVTQE